MTALLTDTPRPGDEHTRLRPCCEHPLSPMPDTLTGRTSVLCPMCGHRHEPEALAIAQDHAERAEAALDADRERVRVLAAAVPDDPMTPFRGDAARRCFWCHHGRHNSRFVHADTCPWLAAHAIKESLSHE